MAQDFDYEHALPSFDALNDPKDDFRRLGEGIEIAEWALRVGEFNQFALLTSKTRRYSIRVNGREHEAPHVTIRCGADIEVRIFLNGEPSAIEPDRAASQGFEKQIRNRDTRRMLLEYVRAHHACLLAAWRANGNPLHDDGGALEVDCEQHGLVPSFVEPGSSIRVPGADLNAHLQEQHSFP